MDITKGLVIKSFLWKLFERVGSQAISFVITIVLARLLLPEQYGIIALITVFLNVCNVIVDGGFTTALIQKKEADELDFSTVWHFSWGMALALYLVLWVAAPWIEGFYAMEGLTGVIRVLSVNLLFFALNAVQRAYIAKRMLFAKLFRSSLVAGVVSGLLGIVLAYQGYGIWALVAQSLGAQLFSCLVLWWTLDWRPRWVFSWVRFKGLFSYGWKIFMANAVVVGFVEMRKIVIGKMYSSSDLACYERGDQLANIVMKNVFTSMQTVLLPVFSESQDNVAHVKAMMRRTTKLVCFVIYPLTAGLAVAAEPLVRLLLTDKWIEVVPFLQILCVANFFTPITISNWEAIKALGHSGIVLKLEILKKVLDLGILLVSCFHGVYAIAWGIVLYNFLCLFINLYPNKKLLGYGIGEQLWDALPTALIAIAMGAAVWWVGGLGLSLVATLGCQVAVGGCVYLSLCALCKEESFGYVLGLIRQFWARKSLVR